MTTDQESDQAHQEQKEESMQVINCGVMDLTKHQGYLTPVVGVTKDKSQSWTHREDSDKHAGHWS